MELADIFQGRKVAVFLRSNRSLLEAIKRASPEAIALYRKRRARGADFSGVISRRYSGERDVSENNAETVLLGGTSIFSIRHKDFRHVGHAGFILLPLGPLTLLSGYFLLRHIARKQLLYAGRIRLSGSGGSSHWLVFKNVNKRYQIGPRYFFSTNEDARSFFQRIQDLNYCVLTGQHPKSASSGSSEALCILVHNDHANEFMRRITGEFGFSPIEIYTPFSVPGHSLSSHVSYLPSARALDVLDRSRECETGVRRPAVKDQLLAYCYHLLFHKPDAELAPDGKIGVSTWKPRSSHAALMQLCDKANIPRYASIDEIENMLRREGWFPSDETLTFLARDNKFVRRRYLAFSYKPGLAVFLIRELARKHGLVDEIQNMIAASGFEILRSGPIPETLRQTVTAHFRGGNWALPAGAGEPIHFIIAFDKNPIPVDPKLFRDAVATDNGRLMIKREIRKKAGLGENAKSFNVVHSSDNSGGALEYVEILSPDIYETCKALIQDGNGENGRSRSR